MVKFKSNQKVGMVEYKSGQKVGPAIEAWFKDKTDKDPSYLEKWASKHSKVAGNWATGDENIKKYILDWAEKYPEIKADWRKGHPNPEDKPGADDLVVPFLKSWAATYPGMWPSVDNKEVKPVKDGSDIQGGFFDAWLQENPNADLEKVPADMVMASGSGLDPHITLENALYQLEDHVADEWVKQTKLNPDDVRKKIKDLLQQKTFSPLGGLAGEPLVNVLEVNMALEGLFKK